MGETLIPFSGFNKKDEELWLSKNPFIASFIVQIYMINYWLNWEEYIAFYSTLKNRKFTACKCWDFRISSFISKKQSPNIRGKKSHHSLQKMSCMHFTMKNKDTWRSIRTRDVAHASFIHSSLAENTDGEGINQDA